MQKGPSVWEVELLRLLNPAQNKGQLPSGWKSAACFVMGVDYPFTSSFNKHLWVRPYARC